MALEKIEAKSLQARVYQQLKSALITGHFQPGQVLVIRDLAEQLGTSPMPIRQSLHRLVSEHALEEDERVRSSVRVPELSRDVLKDLCSVRRIVEGEAAARAAAKRDAALSKRLIELDARIAGAVDAQQPTAVIRANYDFHFEMYRASGSNTLVRTIESLWLQSGPYLHALIDTFFSRPKPSYEDQLMNAHGSILRSVASFDPEAARAAVADDISFAMNQFLAVIDSFEAAPDAQRSGRRSAESA